MALPVIRRGEVHDQEEFERFSCRVPHDNPPTPDLVQPDVRFVRKFENLDLQMPDGEKVRMWVLFDPDKEPVFPGHTIRVRQGQVYHTTLEASVNTHTIHHHGTEQSAFNDGVGHTSFEVSGAYTYQVLASESGTYFYHCHKNTVLHFEMGMYGFLIVDPPTGPGTVFRGEEIIRYDAEVHWAADEIDPTWHDLQHDAGLRCGGWEDAGLHNFNPRYFLLSGVPHPWTRTDERVVVSARAGQTILARVLNAGYTVQRFTFPLPVEVISIDGRALGGARRSMYSHPFIVPAGSPFELTTAQRWDLLIRPAERGSFPVRVEFLDWIRKEVLGTAETFINVA